MADVEQKIKAFILKDIMYSEDETALTSEQPLLQDGIIDSMDLQRLVAFLETEFGIAVADDALVPANFENIDSVVKMVERSQAGPG